MATVVNWREQYYNEIKRSWDLYEELNKVVPVKTRKLTETEYHLIFNIDVNNIKYIEV